MQYMIIETFTRGPDPVYARFRERGRLAPEGLVYVSSVVSADGTRCYQLMTCDDPTLLDAWMAAWRDLVAFGIWPSSPSRSPVTPAAVPGSLAPP